MQHQMIHFRITSRLFFHAHMLMPFQESQIGTQEIIRLVI
jgi:hypothetical protein